MWAGLRAGAVQGCLRGLSAAIGLVRAGLASFRVGHGDVPPNEVFSGVQLWDELFWRAVVVAVGLGDKQLKLFSLLAALPPCSSAAFMTDS